MFNNVPLHLKWISRPIHNNTSVIYRDPTRCEIIFFEEQESKTRKFTWFCSDGGTVVIWEYSSKQEYICSGAQFNSQVCPQRVQGQPQARKQGAH